MGLPIPTDQEAAAEQECLAGGGVMGAMMRSLDWAQTPLGPVENWSPGLRASVHVCLNSRSPVLIWWGKEHVMLYNDAYRPILGSLKHPRALGQPGSACWPEIWDILSPVLARVLAGEESTGSEDQQFLLERSGYLEECYFTYSFSPIREAGCTGGVFTAMTETTGRVLAERRMQTLYDLAAATAAVQSIRQACLLAGEALKKNPGDIPFALLYLLSQDGKQARLAAAAGIEDGPPLINLADNTPDSFAWPLMLATQTGQPHVIKDILQHLPQVTRDPWSTPPQTAAAIPVTRAGQEQDIPYGLLVSGISPRRAFDDHYRAFLVTAATQMAAAIASARSIEEERERVKTLVEADRVKMEFFSRIGNDFRTPLTLMLSPIQDALQAAEPDLTAASRERLETIYHNGLRLLKQVDTLLDFTRLESGIAEAEFEPVDLAALTAGLASGFRSAIEQAGLRFIVDCPALPKPVYVDRSMWEKIVLNLVSNAFKFTLSGEVAVALRWKGDFVALEVRDTGIGIAPEDLPHIFERFHQVRSKRARTVEGSGIGLALVREMSALHGGQVSVESVPEKGTSVTVTIRTGTAYLPASQTRAAHNPFSPNIGTQAYVAESMGWLPQSTHRAAPIEVNSEAGSEDHLQADGQLLIVDDNLDMQEYLTRLLSPYWQVVVVSNGIEALESTRRQLPDLIISDVVMPGMDGIELLHRLRNEPKTRAIPVILLSARAGEEHRIAGLEHGADDYLVKPFSARELIARIESRLELTALRREAQRSMVDQQLEYHTRLEVHRKLLEGREMERQQIARELHDGPIQDLIGLMYSLQSVLALTEDDSMDDFLRGLRDTVQKLVIELRTVCNELRPPSLVQFGVERAIRSHVDDFREKHEQLKISTEMAEDGRLLPEKYRLALYRIYQECLNNIIRHANASEVKVSLAVEDQKIVLEVADNGSGFQVPNDWVALARNGHLGLVGMQERAEAIGGQMQVFSEPGCTRVRVTVPLPKETKA